MAIKASDERAPAHERTPAADAAEAAEAFVGALVAHGVDCLFLNPGTDTFPIQEAISKLEQLGQPAVRTILCPFELVALAAAHGYFAATGRPQAVLVHVDVGTQNLGGMLHNAQRGRAAVLIAAGRSPYTTDDRQRGTRDTHIHWLQEQFDQHGIVRNYVKWEYELRRPDQMWEVVSRAFQIAASDPPGPVYLSLPREVIMAPADDPTPTRRDQAPAAKLGAGDPEVLRDVARQLLASARPLVLTATTGRTRAGFEALHELADLLALPVIERPDRANFPTVHPLHQGFDPALLLPSADFVLILDHDVPYIPTRVQPAADAIVVQIDLDPVKDRIPLWSFPLTRAVRADTASALSLMAREVRAQMTDADRARIDTRRAELSDRHARRREERARAAREASASQPIALEWLASCLGEMHREAPDCVFVDETVTSSRVLWQHLGIDAPGTMFGSCGSALGWGVGAALGISLALPERPVVLLVADGSFIFGEPLAGLWASGVNHAPFLTVVVNNACYRATRDPLAGAYPDGYSVRGNHFVGVHLVPSPRYDLLAPVVGAVGERIEDPADLLPALRRGLERVRAGQSVILDVVLARP
jgi:acetolactate synthase-1/2/3 large subunit